MTFDELDSQMQVFETAHDVCVLPGLFIVVRLDGRSFTHLTQEQHRFDAPYDVRFRDLMLATSEHLMTCGPRVLYAYTQSDDISLLFPRNEAAFGRKERKLNSILAGEASAKFSLLLGEVASFDCRVVQLPDAEHVRSYFRWRYECADRTALYEHSYWALRNEGRGHLEATTALAAMTEKDKLDLLLGYGLDFEQLPRWHRRGIGLHWEAPEKAAQPASASGAALGRRRLKRILELPDGEAYGKLILELAQAQS